MQKYKSFGECLKCILKEENLSASEAARLVGFRSRNSIFRILSGDASEDIKLRFLEALHEALGSKWPEKHWFALQVALSVERLGPERYRANVAFQRVLHVPEEPIPTYIVHRARQDGSDEALDLKEMLMQLSGAARTEIVITGCCEGGLCRLLAECCGEAGDRGVLSIRHYIDTSEEVVTQNILGVLPLVGKQWYNARLVGPGSCPPEMMAIYRLNALHICQWDEQGVEHGQNYIRYDDKNFACHSGVQGVSRTTELLDRWRYDLELLKTMPQINEGAAVFVEYTARYAQLEKSCAIYSIKPDVHFNCIPTRLLEQAVIEGFAQSGRVAEPELLELIEALKRVHDGRFANMMEKHRPTHLVYSLPMMERFMRTGVLSDQFFLQRAYTVEERREIIRVMMEAMRQQPYFNVHFLKPGIPELHYEISFYEGKGVMLTDAYTGYDLDADHSEALITLPAFMESFERYFKDELLAHYVISQADTLRELERLFVMNIQE